MKTLHAKFFVLVVVLVCGNGALALFLQERMFGIFQMTITQALNATLAQTVATEHFANKMPDADSGATLKAEFSKLTAVNPLIEIYLLDKEGQIKAFTAPADEVRRQKINLKPLKDFIANHFAFPIVGDDPKDPKHRKIFSAALIDPKMPERGYLYVILGGADYDAMTRRVEGLLLFRSVLIVTGLGLVVAIAVGYFVLGTQTRKLRRLALAIDEFRASQFKEPIPVPVANLTRGDELDQLSIAYNDMIVHIRRQMEWIAETDVTRRELVAYVLHDLRTPLASLRGYLETLLIKQKSLSAEDQSSYLGIAYKQSDYMSRVIDQLFELVKLEEFDTRMEPEPLQLGDLAQDVLRKFRLKTQQRGIVLESRIASEMPLVYGDVALIERLLDNLIENAIRHTLYGMITVTVAAGVNHAKLEVSDTGSGISPDDIPHIFERHYRAEKKRNHDSGGDGLGLAIAKRIVDLHAGRISVHSEIGVGTSFRVELPLAT